MLLLALGLAACLRDFEAQYAALLKQLAGKRVGLLTNPSAVDFDYVLLADRLFRSQSPGNFSLVCFFAPEHGLRGDRQAGQGDDDYIDSHTGLPVYSLYGVRKAPTPQQLRTVDVLVYDIQDVGTRFYTYIWTLTYLIEAAGQQSLPVLIFDRPNPNLNRVAGCPLLLNVGLTGRILPGQNSSIPNSYGLTVGQFVIYLSPYLKNNLTVIIQMVGFKRDDPFEQQPWVPPSPNMPTARTALLYPGFGILEYTYISEGRGTTIPFQVSGYPGVDPYKLVERISSTQVWVRPIYFTPTFSKFVNETIPGLRVIPKTIDFDPVAEVIRVLSAYLAQAGNSSIVRDSADYGFGRSGFAAAVRAGEGLKFYQQCKGELQKYLKIRESILIYRTSYVLL